MGGGRFLPLPLLGGAILIGNLGFGFHSRFTPHLNPILHRWHCPILLRKRGFDICYSCRRKEPLLVAYSVGKGTLFPTGPRRRFHLFPDPALPPRCRSLPSDYSGTRFDRGHLIPAGVLPPPLRRESYTMANIAPESGGLNRGRWRQIEEGVRFLAEVAGPVEVVTGCCGGRRVLKGGEVVPSYWFKIIYTPGIGRPLLILVQNRKRGKVLFSKRPLQVLKRSCPTLFP